MKKLVTSLAALGAAVSLNAQQQQQYSWQRQHAKVLPTGGLEWAPEQFKMPKGQEVRYIDFDAGNDARDGKTKNTAWKRHPLDPAFGGDKAQAAAADMFVFKRGVAYRGELRGKAEGSPQRPLIFTSDPTWGTGDATIAGSELVTGWKQGADHPGIPDAGKVWFADLDFAPRNVWVVARDGKATRVPLAREPNWTVTDPEDVMSNWYEWEQPEWWIPERNKKDGKHLGISAKLANRRAEDLVGGLVWSEYGIVMGQPICVSIDGYDPGQNGIVFEGPWLGHSEQIITKNRFFLEDKPNFLDDGVNGEFWFDKKGDGGRLYLRLPGDANPNSARIEAAKRIHLMEFSSMKNVEVSGLAFRFTNVRWPMWENEWRHPDVLAAAIRCIEGSVENVTIACNRFENIHKAVRFHADAVHQSIRNVTVRDNDMAFIDHGAIEIGRNGGQGGKSAVVSDVSHVNVLRNRIREAGLRMARANFGHTLVVSFANPSEIAGNILERTYGAGVFVFGGKGSGEKHDAPFARMLVHHNKAEQTLLACNDWGGIETWQGGPVYVYNNISANPGGFWNWAGNSKDGYRLGFAYYLDGGFKNYLFNNIAWGANNDINSKYANRTAFYHAVPTILNAYFNNTAYRFLEGTAWSPAGGRQLFLGNIFDDIAKEVFIHGKQKEDANAVYDHYLNNTIAYGRNAFHKIPDTFGSLEGAFVQTDFAGFLRGAQEAKLLAHDVGTLAATPLLRDPANRDLRPVPNNNANAPRAVKFFVPWSLSQTLGEWQFRRDNKDPATALDEAWWMRPEYNDRSTYKDVPRADLKGAVTADDYVEGPLEDWTAGALRIRPNVSLTATLPVPATAATAAAAAPAAGAPGVATPADWLEITHPAVAKPGEELKLTIRLKGDLAALNGKKLLCHLHWMRAAGWGGYDTHVYVAPTINGAGPYEMTLRPNDHEGLTGYNLLIAISPSDDWGAKTQETQLAIPAGAAPPPVAAPNAPDGLIVELFAKFEPNARGQVLSAEGLSLSINNTGALVFTFGNATATSTAPVANGQWRHILCEYTGAAKPELRVYINGKPAGTAKVAGAPALPARAVLTVGNGADMTLDFLRLALSSLEQSHTTIEELFAWQFDGPFLRDFTGKKMSPTRPAGALDY